MCAQLSKQLRVVLNCDRSAPSRAREAISRLAEAAPIHDDAVLVASELVSNAVRHSGCMPEEEIEVVAQPIERGVRIEVADAGRSGDAPRLCRTDALQPGGLGLRLVAALAKRWGAERNDGLRVWAELAA